MSEATALKEGYVYVRIPAEDLYDNVHPGVHIIAGIDKKTNIGRDMKFEAGKTYMVTEEVGAEVERRLAMFQKEQIRLLRPKADTKSVGQVNAGSAWTIGGQRPTVFTGEVPLEANEKVVFVE